MKKSMLIFLIILTYSFISAADITKVEVQPANGKTRIKIIYTGDEPRYFDVFDKTTNKFIIKLMNAKINSSFSRSYESSDIRSVRAAQNNPQDVWVVVECRQGYLTKEQSMQNDSGNKAIIYDLFFPVRKNVPDTQIVKKDIPVVTAQKDTIKTDDVSKKNTSDIPVKTDTTTKSDRTVVTVVENELGMANVISIKSEDAVIVRIKTGGPDDVGIEDAMLKRYIDASDYEKARLLLNEYTKKYPDYAAYFWEKMAELFLKNNDFSNAREYYRKAYDRYPEKSQDKSRAAYFTGQVSYTMNQYPEALVFTDYTVSYSTVSVLLHKAYLLRGDVYHTRGDEEKAIDNYTRALNSASSTDETAAVLYKLYRLYREKKDYKSAFTYLSKLKASGISLQPARKKEVDFDTADLYYLLTEKEKALDAYKIIIDTYSNDPDADWAFYQSGTIYRSMGKNEEALKIFNELIVKYPKSYWSEHARFHVKSLSSPPNEKKQ